MSGRLKYGLVEELAAEIGYTAMNSLVDWFGGGRLFVPHVIPETHPIAQIIGMPAAAHLAKWMDRHERLGTFDYGDRGSKRRIWLGMNIQREIDRRDRTVVAMLRQGWALYDVHRVSGMSHGHIRALRLRAERMGMLPVILGETWADEDEPLPDDWYEKSPIKPRPKRKLKPDGCR